MTYTPPATQEEFDRIIAERLSRQEQKIRGEYAGMDDLKKKAEQFDQLTEASKSEIQKALDRAAAAEKRAADLEAAEQAAKERAAQEKQVAEWAAEISKATNVPAEALRGATKEELAAHAEILKPAYVASRNGVIHTEGKQPTNEPGTDERAAVRSLFGAN